MYSSITKPTALSGVLSTIQSAVIELDGVSALSVQSNYSDAAPAAKTFTSLTAATGVLDITADITLTSVAKGAARNTTTFTTQVIAAADNPTDTVLVAFSGTSAAIVCTVTPNTGINNPSSVKSFASIATVTPIVLTTLARGTARNTNTFTIQVIAAADNPTNTVLAVFSGTSAAITCTVTPNTGINNTASAYASGSIATSTPIVLTTKIRGTARNTNTFTIQVAAASANPTDTVLVAFSGTSAAITCTVTPNDGTNNGATPVTVTTANLVELINTGLITGKTPTITDGGSLRALQTATGGDTTPLADAGEGDAAVGTFANGTLVPVTVTTANLVELINTGLITGKTPTITDGGSLRALQTATGGDTTPLADTGEGDGLAGTFANGTLVPVTVTTANLVELINTGLISGKTPTITDASALRELQTATGGDTTPLADTGEGDAKVATFSGGSPTTLNFVTVETIQIVAHGYVTGTKAALTTAGVLPTGLSATDYWIIKNSADSICLATSLANAVAGTKVDITAEGSGTHTLTPTTAGTNVFKLQKSNDNVNFIDVTSQTVNLTTATATTFFEVAAPSYRYMKMLYTPAAGQVNFEVIVNQVKA